MDSVPDSSPSLFPEFCIIVGKIPFLSLEHLQEELYLGRPKLIFVYYLWESFATSAELWTTSSADVPGEKQPKG